MVDERITDGTRIAQLLASELDGRTDRGLDRVTVANARPGVEPSMDGARAYDVTVDDDRVASVYVQPDRARLELRAGVETAARVASEAGLRVRPVGGPPPRTIVFVESGAAAKPAAAVVAAVAREYSPGE